MRIEEHNIGLEENFLELLRLEAATGYQGRGRMYLAVDRRFGFGQDVRPEDLRSLIRSLPGGETPGAILDKSSEHHPVQHRFSGFSAYAAAAAGLLDGVNPCAISALVFFMSLLTASGVRDRSLLFLGASFCLASFLTYLALGFGLFRAFYLFSGFSLLRRAVEISMAAVLLFLSFLSFRDAVRFRNSGRPADVTLQLSSGMKKRIHSVMRRGIHAPGAVLSGFLIGSAVTLLESVCTGQIYVPVLILILRESEFSESRAWFLLLLYNAMFVLPLLAVFIAVYFGLRIESLAFWSRSNVVCSKVLTGLFFILMSMLLIVL